MTRWLSYAQSLWGPAEVAGRTALVTGLLLVPLLVLSGCTGLMFAAANAPTWFGPGSRDRAVYAPQRELALDVYHPDASASPRPMVVFVHGGSWQIGSRRQYAFVGRALAGAGYVAVLPDYRKYPDVQFPAFVSDVAEAVAYARAHADEWGADPGQLFLMGHSAGAHIAVLLAMDSRYLRAAGSAQPVRGVIGLSGPYDFSLRSETLRGIFAAGSTTRPEYRPVAYVSPGAPPALLIHGTADTIVRPAHSERLAAALRAADVPVTLELLPGLTHGGPVAALSTLRRGLAPVLPAIQDFIAAQAADSGAVPADRRAGAAL